MLAISLFIFTACEEDPVVDPPPPTFITVLPVDDIFAGQTGTDTITVMWNHSQSISETWFKEYELTIYEASAGSQDIRIDKNTTSKAINGLDKSKTYTFSIVAIGVNPDDGQEVKSIVKEIKWGLATHFTTNDVGAKIRVYVRQSSIGSGLNLYSQAQSPSSWTVANGQRWNLALGGKDTLIFGTASTVADYMKYNLTGVPVDAKITNPLDFDTDNLTNLVLNMDLSTFNYADRTINLKTDNVATSRQKGLVFFAKVENNYSKIIVLKNGDNNGYLHDSNQNNAYIELLVSYQTRSNVPYAKPNF